MRASVCALVALVACSKQGGLILEVDPTPGVDWVRIYVGTSPLDHPDHLNPPNDAEHAPDLGVFIDQSDGGSDIMALDSTVQVELQGGGLPTIPALIVVGYSGNTAVAAAMYRDIDLPTDDIGTLTVQLQPGAPLGTGSAVELGSWGPQPDAPIAGQSCAGFVTTDGNGTRFKTFIVDDGDHDCDGFANDDADECDPLWYHATVVDDTGSDACGQPSTDALDLSECRLGGPTCTDGVPASGSAATCTPGMACMPPTECGCAQDEAMPLACMLSGSAQAGYSCSIPTDSTATCELSLPPPPTGGMACSSATISTDGVTFSTQLDYGSVTFDVSVGSGCEIDLTPDPASTGGSGSAAPNAAILDVGLANGQSLVMPVELDVDTGGACGPDACTYTTDLFVPGFVECAAGWSMPTPVANLEGFTHPSLTGDMLEIFVLDPTGALFSSTRASVSDAFPTPTPVTLPNIDVLPMTFDADHVSSDGEVLYLVDQQGVVWELARDANGAWSSGFPILQASPDVNDFSPDGSDGTGSDAFVATTAAGSDAFSEYLETGTGSAGVWSQVSASPQGGATPFVSIDGLDLYFAQADPIGYRINVQTRAEIGVAFTPPVVVPELGAASFPQAPWVSPDGRTIYYASDVGAAGPRIFTATR